MEHSGGILDNLWQVGGGELSGPGHYRVIEGKKAARDFIRSFIE